MPVIDARQGTPLGGQIMMTPDEQAHQLAMLAERFARTQQMAEQRRREESIRAATSNSDSKGMTIEDRLALMMADQAGRRGDMRLQTDLRADQAAADHGRTMERDTAARTAAERIAEIEAERRMKMVERESELTAGREKTAREERRSDPLYQAQLEAAQFANENARTTADTRRPADREAAAHERNLDTIQMQMTGQRPGADGENAMPQSAREALAMQAAQAGDFESYQQIMAGKDPKSTPYFQRVDAARSQEQQDTREALLKEASGLLDSTTWMPFKQKEPWEESANPFTGKYWSEERGDTVKRAQALLARHPKFGQMGIDAETIADYYRNKDRWGVF